MITRDRVVAVGMGEMAVSREADVILAAYGLGSCVGVAAWDPVARVGGLAHILLPSSAARQATNAAGKFADTALPALLRSVTRHGAERSRLIVKVAGGAQVLALGGPNSALAIGEKNVAAVRQAIRQHELSLAAEDVGGNSGRTMLLYLENGRVTVQVIGRGPRDL